MLLKTLTRLAIGMLVLIGGGMHPANAFTALPPLLELSMPNPSHCGASTFDVYTGLSADNNASYATSVDISNPLLPTMAVSGTSFNFFWGFVDHDCGGPGTYGAAVNTFAVATTGTTGQLTLTDHVPDAYVGNTDIGPYTYTIGTINVLKYAGNGFVPATVINLNFVQQDFVGIGNNGDTVTGIDFTFNLGQDPPVQVQSQYTLPGARSPVSFSLAPEPASLVVFGSAMAGLLARRRRKS